MLRSSEDYKNVFLAANSNYDSADFMSLEPLFHFEVTSY